MYGKPNGVLHNVVFSLTLITLALYFMSDAVYTSDITVNGMFMSSYPYTA